MMDKNLAWGIKMLALSVRGPHSPEKHETISGGIDSAPVRGAGTPAQESDDEQLTPREIAENELRETREWNSHE